MKIKKILLFFVICLMAMLVPNIVLAANSEGTYTDEFDGNEYELFDDNTATVTYIKPDTNSGYSKIHSQITTGEGKTYSITKIAEDALAGITEEQELWIYLENAPVLEGNVSFDKISAIYVPHIDAQGYTEANGWPVSKVKCYKITKQPVSPSQPLKAGNITAEDTLTIKVEVPIGTSMSYGWYYCDAQGNITHKNPVGGNVAEFQIPTDLSYDNESGQAKEYYFICVVGDGFRDTIYEYSDVVKVVVEPGAYKVTFNYSSLSGEVPAPVVLSVNDERKLNKSDMTKIPTEAELEQYKEGATFVGWTPDYGETVIDVKDLETKRFEKNMTLYPLWKTKVNYDANGGKFEDGSTVFTTYISNFGILDEETPEIYTDVENIFLGYGYEKIGGNFYEGETLTEETTLYAKWANSIVEENENKDEGVQNTPTDTNTDEKDDTPKTGNNLQAGENILLLLTAIVSILTIIKFRKNIK